MNFDGNLFLIRTYSYLNHNIIKIWSLKILDNRKRKLNEIDIEILNKKNKSLSGNLINKKLLFYMKI
jgi:hypothetical protein